MEKVITVALQRQAESDEDIQASLEELEQLVETAGGQVLEAHTQKKDRPDPATYIGKGKVEELRVKAEAAGIHTLIFDDPLKPAQQRNLEEATGTKIVDRTRLILDIFAQRARTSEGKLQVELAQMNYLLPRITERFGRFEQQVGGIGTRGPGERKLEVDQRRIRDRITALKRDIEGVRNERDIQREGRKGVPVPLVALVGYTNAGKSTLLNTLLKLSAGKSRAQEHGVYADDKLFATLDPTTRRVRLPGGRIILFSDTVGFIRKLPTELVAAFRSTLEELKAADLLVHVVDGSDPAWEEQEKTVLKIITDLGAEKLPRLTAYNKMDRFSPSQKQFFSKRGGVLVSASSASGIEELLKAVEQSLARQWLEKDLLLPFTAGAQLAQLHEHMDVLSQETTEKGIKLRVRTHPATWAQFDPSRKDRKDKE